MTLSALCKTLTAPAAFSCSTAVSGAAEAGKQQSPAILSTVLILSLVFLILAVSGEVGSF